MKLNTLEVETLMELVSQQIELIPDCDMPKYEIDMSIAFFEALQVKLEVEYARLSLLDELEQ